MKNNFIDLYKLIEENKGNLKIEGLGLKFRDYSSETLTTLLHPILELDNLDYIDNDDVDIEMVKKIDKWFNLEIHFNLKRLLVIGSDAKEVFEELKNNNLIYEDLLNKTIIKNNEYYFTVMDKKNCFNKGKSFLNKDVLVLILSNDKFYYYDGKLDDIALKDLKPFNEFTLENMFNVRGVPLRLAHSLIHSLGFMLNDLRFYSALRLFPNSLKEHVINNANSIFVKSFTKYATDVVRTNFIGVKVTSDNLRTIFSNAKLEHILDLEYKKVVTLYGNIL